MLIIIRVQLLVYVALVVQCSSTFLPARRVAPTATIVARQTNRWWQMSALYQKLRLSSGIDAMRLARRATSNLDWWQFTDGRWMANDTNCRTFQYNANYGEHLDMESSSPTSRCGKYMQDAFAAYDHSIEIAASGARLSAQTLLELNTMVRTNVPYVFKSLTGQPLGHSEVKAAVSGMVCGWDAKPMDQWRTPAFSARVCPEKFRASSPGNADAEMRDSQLLAVTRTCGKLFSRRDSTDSSVDKYMKERANLTCAPCDQKMAFLQRYIDELYASIDLLPAPTSRDETSWNEWLHAVGVLVVRMEELHPFRNGNSRTRVLALDILMAQAQLHPLMIWDFKNLSPVQQTIRSGLVAWEVAATTNRNPWLQPAFQEAQGVKACLENCGN